MWQPRASTSHMYILYISEMGGRKNIEKGGGGTHIKESHPLPPGITKPPYAIAEILGESCVS